MQLKLMRVFVDDQEKALNKWLTVVSAQEPEGTQLLLEPNDNPTAKTYQQEIFRQGRSATTFFVGDLQEEYARLKKHGVTFTTEPTKAPGAAFAVLDDTCGNLVQITQTGL